MRKDRLLPVLTALCMLSLVVVAAALWQSGADAAFAPPPFEPMARTGTPAVPEEAEYRELDAGMFRVGLCGKVRVREGMAEVGFANPAANSVWLRLRILDEEGNILGQTGLLRPGEYVDGMPVGEIPAGMPVVLKVMAYEPETYHSAGAVALHTRIAE